MANGAFFLKIDHAAVQELLQGPHGPVAKDLLKKALMVQRRAKALAPVDTGRLRASIAYRLGSDGQGIFAQVGSDVNYAAFQEFGTYRQAGQPYLRPALAAVLRGGA